MVLQKKAKFEKNRFFLDGSGSFYVYIMDFVNNKEKFVKNEDLWYNELINLRIL